ncbi:hypothetical protein [Sphingomonas sp. Leaf343]|nr:hypothetical protein [Sphingomonas sp. Leaf343]
MLFLPAIMIESVVPLSTGVSRPDDDATKHLITGRIPARPPPT